ncbi:MAG: glutathione S-transferase family protein [Cyanophyceae cyanobacterium]
MTMKLYGGARTRASIVHWYLEELGVTDYEFVMLDMQAGEHLQEPFTAINPFGKVPAIATDDGYRLWESGAILLYVDEKYGPTKSAEERAIAAQWVIFANATLGPGVFVEASREKQFPRLMAPLNALLEGQDYIAGDGFTVADVAVGSMLFYIPFMLKIEFTDYPAIAAYLQRIMARPAFVKAILNR